MNTHDSAGGSRDATSRSKDGPNTESGHGSDTVMVIDAVELILRELVGMRTSTATDDQLAQLLRLVDSATWSAPVPMTVLIDGALLRGLLVPSEVSAAYLDDALSRSARNAMSQFEDDSEVPSDPAAQGAPERELLKEQARAFLNRTRRRLFSSSQARTRQRNANALIALSRWRASYEHDSQPAPLDTPGSYADPESVTRAVIPYTAGQRAMTLSDVRMLVGGEWLAIPSPVRVAVHRIGAWTVDH